MKDSMLRYTLRISPALMEKFAYVAEYEGRTKNRQIEYLIKNCIAEFERGHGQIDLKAHPLTDE